MLQTILHSELTYRLLKQRTKLISINYYDLTSTFTDLLFSTLFGKTFALCTSHDIT